ncbi:MAG: acylphosphatase [Chitinophagaceae bacterium]|nr:acylphosphatase [Chitinophagaceae bacterium]
MLVHKHVVITGKVQGVFFRGSTREQAEKLGVFGHVQNMPDGSVVLHAEGEEEAVNALIAWCHYGPPRAEVSGVIVEEGEIKGYKNFTVIRF